MFCSSMFQSDVSPYIISPYCCWNLWAIWLGMALGTRPWKPAIVATNAATIGRYQCSSWVTVNVSNASILSQETSTLSSYAWVLGRPSTKCCGYLKISEIWKSENLGSVNPGLVTSGDICRKLRALASASFSLACTESWTCLIYLILLDCTWRS